MAESKEKNNGERDTNVKKTDSGNEAAKTPAVKKAAAAVVGVFSNKKTRKRAIGVIAAVAAVCLIIVIGASIAGNSGENGVVKKVMTAYLDEDALTLIKLAKGSTANGDGLKAFKTEMDYQNMFEADKAYYTDKLSGAYKLSFKTVGEKKLSDSEVNDLLMDRLDDESLFKKYYGSIVKEDVVIAAKCGREKVTMNKSVYLIRVSDQWTLYGVVNN